MTDTMIKLFEHSLVLDTETTDLDFKKAEVIEYASANVIEILKTVESGEYEISGASLYKPAEAIKPEVSAINGITNRMVANEQEFSTDLTVVQAELDKHEFYVAHNAFYDRNILERYGLKLPKEICTMRMAKKLYANNPNITAFNLPYLRYALDLPIDDSVVAHRASDDIIVAGVLFMVMVNQAIDAGFIDDSFEDLGDQIVTWLNKPITIEIMPFGKHKGEKLVNIPLSYWNWALENMNSLQESKPEYDKDFAASVAIAVEKIFEKNGG